MYYVADGYVRVDKMLLKKGDILPALPEEKIKWLLDAGAIHVCNPEPLISSDLTEEEAKIIADSLDAIKKEDDAEKVVLDKSDPPFFVGSETNTGEWDEELVDPEEESEDSEQPVQTDAVDEAELQEGEMDIPEVPEINAMEGIVVEAAKPAEPSKQTEAPKQAKSQKTEAPKKKAAPKSKTISKKTTKGAVKADEGKNAENRGTEGSK